MLDDDTVDALIEERRIARAFADECHYYKRGDVYVCDCGARFPREYADNLITNRGHCPNCGCKVVLHK